MTIRTSLTLMLLFFYSPIFAVQCPDPHTSSLKDGQVPAPWVLPAFSRPPNTRPSTFIQAYLFTGSVPGVLCSYSNSLGNYSIFWSTTVQTPLTSPWILSLDGYFCVQSLGGCSFMV